MENGHSGWIEVLVGAVVLVPPVLVALISEVAANRPVRWPGNRSWNSAASLSPSYSLRWRSRSLLMASTGNCAR